MHVCVFACRDAGQGGGQADLDKGTEITRLGRRKKGRRAGLSPRSILLLLLIAVCIAGMVWFMLRAAPQV